MPARMYIQFAAGELEADLDDRTAEGYRPEWTARRDLTRYYHVMRDELARLTLSEAEATLVVAALRSVVIDGSSYRYLWTEVEDYLCEPDEGDEIPTLAPPEQAALVAKLRALSPGGQMAVAD